MEEAPSTSQGASNQGSQSILIPESPGSPDLLEEPHLPASPRVVVEILNLEEQSETYTQAEPTEGTPSSLPEVRLRPTDNGANDAEDSNDEPPAKLRKLSQKSNEDVDGEETCPICLDSWGNSGEHRLVSLKCGHLFGSQCVERWLRAQKSKDRSCPTCKSKASMRDLRPIYARRLVAADMSQITSLQNQLDNLQEEKSRIELALQKSRIAHRSCVIQLEVLMSSLRKSQAPKEQPVRKSRRFALEKNPQLQIHKDHNPAEF